MNAGSGPAISCNERMMQPLGGSWFRWQALFVARLERRRHLPSLQIERSSAAGNGKQPAVAAARPRKRSFIADRRGAIAFETVLVYITLVSFVLMPIADLALAGLQFISAWGALRGFGEYLQYNPPSAFDPTSLSAWQSALPTSVPGDCSTSKTCSITGLAVMCGDSNTACTSANAGTSPLVKYYSYTTTVTLAPLVWKSVLCPGGNCTYTLHYSERFQ